jgi:multiple sugar transport system permease protein
MNKAQAAIVKPAGIQSRGFAGINRKELKQIAIGLAFISPWVIGFLALNLYPIAASFYYSLTRYSPISEPTFIGLRNYEQLLFTDTLFGVAVSNTLYYVIYYVPLSNVLALMLAMLLNTKVPGLRFFRTIFYLPSILPTVAIAVVWIWLMHPQYGIVSAIMSALGLPAISWFTDPNWSKPGLILLSLWGVGWMMVTYLAALQDVPQEYYESASLDGANAWAKFRNVTIPLISPVILFNVIICLISSFQYFTEAYIITQGGPSDSTLFFSLYLFQNAFSYFKMGYASAMAWMLFIIILILTILIFRTSARRVYYQDS